MSRRTFSGMRVAVVIALVIMACGGTAQPTAVGAPDDGGLPAESPTLGLQTLGTNPTISFYGVQGTETLTIPVPPGLLPAELTAIVEIPVNLRAGTLAVTQDDRTISRIPLPDADRVPVVIPLAGVAVVNNAVTLVLRSYLVPLDGYCLDPTNPLRLTDAAIRYDGVETPPTVVAEFLPPILRKLTVFIPARPLIIESDAAIGLATAVVARYGKQNPEIVLMPLADGQAGPVGPSAPMERQIVIREGPEVTVGLRGSSGVPSLLISGLPDQLVNQARLLSSNISRLAMSSSAVVGPLKSAPQLPADLTTIRQLGQPGVNATALSPQVSIGLDQTRLGRSVENVRVHLRGSYTPLPASVGGSVVAAINGETIDQWPTDGAGAIDRWVDIPNRLIQRYTNLGVAINISGNTGRCGEFQPITLTIDGDSPVQTTRADPPLGAGFQSAPQALMPRMEIGVGEDVFADTRRAVSVLVGMQRTSALPLDTVVVPRQQAIDSPNPAVIMSADGFADPRITLPVSATQSGELKVTGIDGPADATTLTLDPGQRFGSLQMAVDGDRTLLIATSNGDPAQLDALLAWLDSEPMRWSRLSGTAVLAPAGGAPVMFAADASQEQVMTVDNGNGLSHRWFGMGVVALVAVGAGLIWWRSRSKTPSG